MRENDEIISGLRKEDRIEQGSYNFQIRLGISVSERIMLKICITIKNMEFCIFLKCQHRSTFHHLLIFFFSWKGVICTFNRVTSGHIWLLSILNVAIPKWEMYLRSKYTVDFKDLVQKMQNISLHFLYWLHVKMIFCMYQFK